MLDIGICQVLESPFAQDSTCCCNRSEIPEIPCVEITDELLRTTGHMNNFCLREFVFYVFQPNKFK